MEPPARETILQDMISQSSISTHTFTSQEENNPRAEPLDMPYESSRNIGNRATNDWQMLNFSSEAYKKDN